MKIDFPIGINQRTCSDFYNNSFFAGDPGLDILGQFIMGILLFLFE